MGKIRRVFEEILIEKGIIGFPDNMKYIMEDMNMSLIPIKYFRKDGIKEKPDGVYIAKGMIYKEIAMNENSFVIPKENILTEELLSELISNQQYGLDKYRGGIIVFATTVNAVIDDIEPNKIKGAFKKIFYSVKNYIMKNNMLNNLIKTHNNDYKGEFSIGSVSIGNFFKGTYIEGNNIFNDSSSCIYIGGVPSEVLVLFATELCREFKQRTVLVRDENINKVFLVDSKGVSNKTPEEKLKLASKDIEKAKQLNNEV